MKLLQHHTNFLPDQLESVRENEAKRSACADLMIPRQSSYNSYNNEHISRVPFHVKHAKLH